MSSSKQNFPLISKYVDKIVFNDDDRNIIKGKNNNKYTPEVIKYQRESLLKNLNEQLLDTFPEMFLIVNSDNRTVYSNNKLLNCLGYSRDEDICGMLPGEFTSCLNSNSSEGCGSGKACQYCGIFKSIAFSSENVVHDDECTMLGMSKDGLRALNFGIHTVPIQVDGETFTIIYMQDLSDHKWKEIMEQVFYHDILNAVNNIVGATSLILHADELETKDLAEITLDRAYFMGREIKAHRMLMAAEKKELKLEISPINIGKLLNELSIMFKGSPLAIGKKIIMKNTAEGSPIHSDKRILLRILENLIKNALEASERGQSVVLDFEESKSTVMFSVRNSSFIPKEVQLRLFRRSFSTKGHGRGLGTYSVKMLTENYLKGVVGLKSDQNFGTTFLIEIPKYSD